LSGFSTTAELLLSRTPGFC